MVLKVYASVQERSQQHITVIITVKKACLTRVRAVVACAICLPTLAEATISLDIFKKLEATTAKLVVVDKLWTGRVTKNKVVVMGRSAIAGHHADRLETCSQIFQDCTNAAPRAQLSGSYLKDFPTFLSDDANFRRRCCGM